MTCEADRRQFVAPRGHHFMKTKVGDFMKTRLGDFVVAYALPRICLFGVTVVVAIVIGRGCSGKCGGGGA